jgi:hypothetical protein
MDYILILAQEGAALEAADKGLSLLERAQAGGVPLISLCIAVICGLAFYWQLKQNKALNEDALKKSEQREKDKDAATKIRLGEQETLLREMLDRDRESQEAQLAAVQAVQGFTHVHTELRSEIASLRRAIEALQTSSRDVEETLRRRFRDA